MVESDSRPEHLTDEHPPEPHQADEQQRDAPQPRPLVVVITGASAGVGRATTRAVVQAISAIVVIDMLFVFAVTR
jgi:hypothetical protein